MEKTYNPGGTCRQKRTPGEPQGEGGGGVEILFRTPTPRGVTQISVVAFFHFLADFGLGGGNLLLGWE